jgi:glycosyltransferase involved in cell wall biosynthesis
VNSIDVIMATHRNDAFLKEALESVKNSLGVEVRIILIDDRESDSSPLPEEIVDVILKTRGGVGFEAAVNLAVPHILSEFVTVLGSDDLVTPDRFKRQISRLEETGGNLSLCKLQKFDKKGFCPSLTGQVLGKKYSPKVLMIAPIGCDGSWLAREQWWKENAWFKEPDSDWALGLRVMMDSSIAYVPDGLYLYRMHLNQITRSSVEGKRLTETVYSDWVEQNRRMQLPPLSKEEFAHLLNPAQRKDTTLDLRNLSKWFNSYLKILTPRELINLRQVIGRKAIHLQLQTIKPIFGVKMAILQILAVPALAFDIFRINFKHLKGGNSELRSRIWLDS